MDVRREFQAACVENAQHNKKANKRIEIRDILSWYALRKGALVNAEAGPL